ncbi:MAG: hypothetical protein WED00_08055 [Aquisalimonadaceae bacterium]
MERYLRPLARYALEAVDRHYQRHHALQPVGPVLFVSRGIYRGSAIRFEDGTRLGPNDTIGVLHFNNARISCLQASSATAAARAFTRLMRSSLRHLAERSRHDPAFSDLAVYHGITWLPPHGSSAGFLTSPLPQTLETRLRSRYFRLLLWTFAPVPRSRMAATTPNNYFLTRTALLSRNPAPSQPAGNPPGSVVSSG